MEEIGGGAVVSGIVVEVIATADLQQLKNIPAATEAHLKIQMPGMFIKAPLQEETFPGEREEREWTRRVFFILGTCCWKTFLQ